jgi:hypothetical protein
LIRVRARARVPNRAKVRREVIENATRPMSVRLKTWVMNLNPTGERVGAVFRIPAYDDGVSVG